VFETLTKKYGVLAENIVSVSAQIWNNKCN
jgi:hypothetical protein